jgi:hypothetical protein
MPDPSEYVFSETFWDGTTVNKTGREATMSGSECVEVRAETVSWAYPPYVFSTYRASSEGATDHLLLVDEERGTASRLGHVRVQANYASRDEEPRQLDMACR